MPTPRPIIRGTELTYYDADDQLRTIEVDSPEWERWTAYYGSFRFDTANGALTVRKCPRRGWFYRRRSTGRRVKFMRPNREPDLEYIETRVWWYWYAFRTINVDGRRHTFKAYIGANPSMVSLQKASVRIEEKITAWAERNNVAVETL